MNKIYFTNIKLPRYTVDRVKVGKNEIIQIGQQESTLEVDVFKYSKNIFLLEDKIGRKYYLKLFGTNSKLRNKNVLMAKGVKDIKDLDEKSVLEWERHESESAVMDSKEILNSWKSAFHFNAEDELGIGLRNSQIGAIHSIASYWSVNKNDGVGTVVMPTGTGKTEVMLSTLVNSGCKKVLVMVPSSALREQLSNKFSILGCLREITAVEPKAFNPRVAIVKSGINSLNDVKLLIDNSNVIVTTCQALSTFSDEIKRYLASECTHLFIDEAHHVPAKTWGAIKKLFKDKHILQFTATPFRRDGKKVEGDIIYNYPLGMAQEDNYFRKINLVKIQEFDEGKADEEIAKSAIKSLKLDKSNKLDHILMARCKNKNRANTVLNIYKNLAPEYNPQIIHSDKNNKESVKMLANGTTSIIVCVNMLGEGFDLPKLKVAALHDTHKNLATTLQFIGRFTRDSKNVGDATVIINIGNPQAGKDLNDFYSKHADWNKLIKERSESQIKKEIDFHDFIKGFTGDLAEHISLWNLRPAFSTLVYKTKCEEWLPSKFKEVIPDKYKCWSSVNYDEKLLVAVISKSEEVKWGRYKDIKDYTFELIVIHWSKKYNLLFIQSSDYEFFNPDNLAKAICGDDAESNNGQRSFNVFSGIQRTLARNLGVSTIGNISYTMHFGVDITKGLSSLDKAKGLLNNIFGWGYENGERVTVGCSAKSGKVWSIGGGAISDWRDWCNRIADKIVDKSVKENDILTGFLRPVELKKRHQSTPLIVQWGENILSANEENISIFIGEKEYKLYDVDIQVTKYSSNGSIQFKVYSEDEESFYQIDFSKNGAAYKLTRGKPVSIKKYSGIQTSLEEYVKSDPITVIYQDGSFSFNSYHVPTPQLNTFFDKEKIITTDWKGVDIQVESMGKDYKKNSIQWKVSESLYDDYEVVFNDDASGEAADLIAIRREGESFKLHLVHCKFSSSKKTGSRVDDLYALCGQAQKSIRWKHNGMEYLTNHIKKREEKWQKEGKTRFIKGTIEEWNTLKRFSRVTPLLFEVSIVQPGLEKDKISDDIIQLLGSTEDYLFKTSAAKFNVYSS